MCYVGLIAENWNVDKRRHLVILTGRREGWCQGPDDRCLRYSSSHHTTGSWRRFDHWYSWQNNNKLEKLNIWFLHKLRSHFSVNLINNKFYKLGFVSLFNVTAVTGTLLSWIELYFAECAKIMAELLQMRNDFCANTITKPNCKNNDCIRTCL